MNDSLIAVRYAKALFLSAQEQNSSKEILADMLFLDSLIQEVPEFKDLIESPIIQTSKKLEIAKKLLESSCQDLTNRFLELIIQNRREATLPGIVRNYGQLYRKEQGIVRATLKTMDKAEQGTLNSIQAFLKGKYDSEVDLVEEIDKSLIGGFVLRIEDEQYDSSIASQLIRVKRELEQAIIK